MIVGVGIDVVDVDRFGESLRRTPGCCDRLFTDASATCRWSPGRAVRRQGGAGQVARRAGRAALARRRGCARTTTGRPFLRIDGTVAARAAELGRQRLHVSLSHDAGIASAVVVAEA